MVKNLPAKQFRYLGQEDPLEESRQPTPVLLPGEFHEQRSLAGYSLEGGKELGKTEVTEQACTLY